MVVGKVARELGEGDTESDRAMVAVGKEGKADADTLGAADGDDMVTVKLMGEVSYHHPVRALQSTSPVL